MSSNKHKMAAVPFVNTKGERSMKRVKVERYIAGKRPAYANEDEDEEYYTTDEEGEEVEEEQEEDSSELGEGDDEKSSQHELEELPQPSRSRWDVKEDQQIPDRVKLEPSSSSIEDDEDDDPRFRRLKQLESKPDIGRLPIVHTTSRKINEEKKVVLDEDEEEEEIRQRHALARARRLEEPIGPQTVLGGFSDQQLDIAQQSSDRSRTDDILEDLKLTGLIKPTKLKQLKMKKNAEEESKAMIEAMLTAQVHKKIEEDAKRELEKGASNIDIEATNTDDDDDELAYEEWKLREIKRVLRNKSERAG